MSSKCFCHLNGLAVKDATARQSIDALNRILEGITNTINGYGSNFSEIDNELSETNNRISDLENSLGNISYNSIQTINGTTLKFFVGNQATYNALSDEQRQDLFAIITDDNSKEEIYTAIEELKNLWNDAPVLKETSKLDKKGYYLIQARLDGVTSFLNFGMVYWNGLNWIEGLVCCLGSLGLYQLSISDVGVLKMTRHTNLTSDGTNVTCTFYVRKFE